MAETKTLHGAFEVLVTDGPTWASYKIAAGSEAAAHAMARELWSRRGERGEPYAAPAGMAAEDASHVGGHSVPADPNRFDAALAAAGFLAMGGQIIDASIVAAPKQRNTDDEKRDIKEGRIPPEWTKQPAKLRQKDRDARWTVKYTTASEVWADTAYRSKANEKYLADRLLRSQIVVEEAPAAEAAPEEAPAADPPAADASADAPKGRGGRGS